MFTSFVLLCLFIHPYVRKTLVIIHSHSIQEILRIIHSKNPVQCRVYTINKSSNIQNRSQNSPIDHTPPSKMTDVKSQNGTSIALLPLPSRPTAHLATDFFPTPPLKIYPLTLPRKSLQQTPLHPHNPHPPKPHRLLPRRPYHLPRKHQHRRHPDPPIPRLQHRARAPAPGPVSGAEGVPWRGALEGGVRGAARRR